MNRTHLSTTITRMDAGVEPPGMALRRVDGRCVRFMSRISATLIQACYITCLDNFFFVNGTAVKTYIYMKALTLISNHQHAMVVVHRQSHKQDWQKQKIHHILLMPRYFAWCGT